MGSYVPNTPKEQLDMLHSIGLEALTAFFPMCLRRFA